MGDASFVQSSFRGGEWSKTMQGRVDHPDYKHALGRLKNFVMLETEAITRRSGFRVAANTKLGNPARVLAYTFQDATPYVLEVTDGAMRFFTGTTQVPTNDARTVASISTANPAVVTLDAAHGWADNDTIYFLFRDSTSPLLHARRFTITVTGQAANAFTIADEITGTAIDGSTLAWATPTKPITVSRVHEIVAPFSSTDLATMRLVQSDDAAVLLASAVAPQVLTRATEPDPLNSIYAQFAITGLTFLDGPYLDPYTNGVRVNPSALKGSVALTFDFAAYDSAKAYKVGDYVTSSSVNYKSLIDQNIGNTPVSSPTAWVAIDGGTAANPNGFTSADIGRLVRLYSEPPLWDTGTTYAIGNVVKFNNQYWTALAVMTGASTSTGSINPNQPGVKTTTWAIATQVAKWSWGRITGFSNAIDKATGSVISSTGTTNAANAFDGATSQASASCATYTHGSYQGIYFSLGKNYSSGAQQIGSVTFYPSNDRGFAYWQATASGNIRIQLWASQTAPTLPFGSMVTDTVLTTIPGCTLLGDTGAFVNSTAPVTITSNDTATAWKYVFGVVYALPKATVGTRTVYTGEMQLFAPSGTGTSNGITIELLGHDLLYTNAITTWRLGLFGGANGYPACGTYYEGRIWLSGIVKNRVDGSVPNSLSSSAVDFAPTDEDGIVADSNAISYTFNAPDQNVIYWMEPDQQGIVAGTQAGEWLIQAGDGSGVLTPTNIRARRISKIGCANIEPRRTGLTMTFVQKFKRKLQEYFADVFSGKFSSPNLSVAARHLTQGNVAEIAYQQEPAPVIWARREDGGLIGCTYKRESLFSSQGPNFVAWHQHDVGSGHHTEAMAVGPSLDGNLDSLTVVQNDPALNVRHVEVLTMPLIEEDGAMTDATFLDEHIVPTAMEEKSVSGTNSLVLHGLWHLNGYSATVFAGGLDMGDYTVANGDITIPFGTLDNTGKVTFDEAFYAKFEGAMPVVVGINYVSQGQLLRPTEPQISGARNGPAFGKFRRLQYIVLQLMQAAGVKMGTDFDHLKPALLKLGDGKTSVAVTDLYEGVTRQNAGDKDSFDGQICFEVDRPYPCTITAIGGMLETKDA